MVKKCLKLFLTGIILFTIGIAGVIALEINGYPISDIDIDLPGSGSRADYVIREATVVDGGTYDDDSLYMNIDVSETVNKLDVDVKMGTFTVQTGDKFTVEGYNINSEYLDCNLTDGCLYVSYTPNIKLFSLDFTDLESASIIVTVTPKLLESADFDVKAGHLTVDGIIAKELSLDMSAGDVLFNNVAAYDSAELNMSAGDCIFCDCSFYNDSDIRVTAGSMNYSACRLTGDSDVEITAGTLYMDLAGNRSDYNIKVDRTAGSVYIADGEYSGEYAFTTMVTTYIEQTYEGEVHDDTPVPEHGTEHTHLHSTAEGDLTCDMDIEITAGECNISFCD